VMELAFKQIAATFKDKKYIEILRALDATPIDGGFATELCVAYAWMSKEQVFRAWYSIHVNSIRRCIGESFDEDDIVRLTTEPAPPGPHTDGGAPN